MVRQMTYVPPTDAQLDALMEDPDVTEAMATAAQSGLEYAEAIAPVESGEYREGFKIVVDDNRVKLVNEADHAAAVEWGNRGREGQHILSRVIDRLETDS